MILTDAKKIKTSQEIFAELFVRYPELEVCKKDIEAGYKVLLESYRNGGQLLIAGNGGSAADSDHISGELTKSFMFKRAVDPALVSKLDLNSDEKLALSDTVAIKRKTEPFWGM